MSARSIDHLANRINRRTVWGMFFRWQKRKRQDELPDGEVIVDVQPAGAGEGR